MTESFPRLGMPVPWPRGSPKPCGLSLPNLTRKGGEQRYELHAGHLVTPEKSPYTIYRFTLADSMLVPEDASSTIEVEGRQFKATVVAQESSRVDVQVEAAEALGPFVARALLRVDDLGLLRRLAEALETTASGTETISALTVAMFHPQRTGRVKHRYPRYLLWIALPANKEASSNKRALQRSLSFGVRRVQERHTLSPCRPVDPLSSARREGTDDESHARRCRSVNLRNSEAVRRIARRFQSRARRKDCPNRTCHKPEGAGHRTPGQYCRAPDTEDSIRN